MGLLGLNIRTFGRSTELIKMDQHRSGMIQSASLALLFDQFGKV